MDKTLFPFNLGGMGTGSPIHGARTAVLAFAQGLQQWGWTVGGNVQRPGEALIRFVSVISNEAIL